MKSLKDVKVYCSACHELSDSNHIGIISIPSKTPQNLDKNHLIQVFLRKHENEGVSRNASKDRVTWKWLPCPLICTCTCTQTQHLFATSQLTSNYEPGDQQPALRVIHIICRSWIYSIASKLWWRYVNSSRVVITKQHRCIEDREPKGTLWVRVGEYDQNHTFCEVNCVNK